MSNKLFLKIMAGILISGILCTTALLVYTVHLHSQCSIIAFIANEEEG